MPSAAAATGSASAGISHSSDSSATNRSAKEPLAVLRVATSVPAANADPSRTRPTPSRPAVNGSGGWPP